MTTEGKELDIDFFWDSEYGVLDRETVVIRCDSETQGEQMIKDVIQALKIKTEIEKWYEQTKKDYSQSKGSDAGEWEIKPLMKKLKRILTSTIGDRGN